MDTSTAAATHQGVTIINVFTVPPGRSAEELLQLLRNATTEVMQGQPGFLSATLYVSLDATQVVNMAVWESEAAFGRVMQLPDVHAHFALTQTFPRAGHFYQLASSYSASPPA